MMLFLAGMSGAAGPAKAFGAEMIDTERECVLELDYHDGNGTGFSGAEFAVYRVADVSTAGSFSMTEEYNDYPVSLRGLDQSGWRDAAQTLAGYAQAGSHTALYTGKTDENGVLRLEGLQTGLYLVTGKTTQYGHLYYTPSPQLVALPGEGEDESRIYDVTVTVKWGRTEGTQRELRVQKIWVNDSAGNRPENLTVELYRDGSLQDTVILNRENNWRHVWTGLSDAYSWTVVEKEVPGRYTVTSVQDEKGFILTNTYHKPSTPGGGGGGGNGGGGGGGGNPPSNIPDEGVPTGDMPFSPLTVMEELPVPLAFLPQTGMLWWPVPVLLCLGLLFVAAGIYRRRS